MIRNMCRWACNFLISHTRIKTRTRGNFYQLCTMFNPSSYDQPIPTHPHMIKIKHSWDVLNNRSKKRPVHQRRQMKCLLVAITILLRSLFSLSLSQYLCHGLHNFWLFWDLTLQSSDWCHHLFKFPTHGWHSMTGDQTRSYDSLSKTIIRLLSPRSHLMCFFKTHTVSDLSPHNSDPINMDVNYIS